MASKVTEISLVLLGLVVVVFMLVFFISNFASPNEENNKIDSLKISKIYLDEEFSFVDQDVDYNCPFGSGLDNDGDGLDDLCDNCPSYYNPNQEDGDLDGLGDACDFERESRNGREDDGEEDIECLENRDCGEDGFIGESFCASDNYNVSRNFKIWTCNRPGEEDSFCSSEIVEKVSEECNVGCLDGTCANAECLENRDCGEDGFIGDLFCSGNEIHQFFKIFMCIDPGTVISMCGSDISEVSVDSCEYACTGGECIRCDEDLDCNDGDEYTIDLCMYPGMADSYCDYSPVCVSSVEICDGLDNDCNGEIDEGGVCDPGCIDECSIGIGQCFGDDKYKVCGNFDEDSCLEFGEDIFQCATGERCNSGVCAPY